MYTRNNCVICNNTLEKINELKDNVISFSPTISPSVMCHKEDLPIGYCNICYSIQYMKLIDPNILYKDSHNETFNTPTWKYHHNSFYIFFKNELSNINKCIEVGGGQCILAEKIIKDYPIIDYSILDLIDTPLNKFNIKIGNCEEYIFTEECVILSHVFEHLYNPKAFLQNVKKSTINYVILSVPNLEYLLQQDNLNLIHIEHTFYFNKYHLEYLFNEISFIPIKHKEFDNHSLFYIFKRDNTIPKIPTYIISDIKNYYVNRDSKLNNLTLNIQTNIWIAPAGHYGHVIYSFLVNKGYTNKIKAFIDNDISKQGKYLNGTDIMILPFSELSNVTDITIILYAGIYTNEIRLQILSLNNNINIICI